MTPTTPVWSGAETLAAFLRPLGELKPFPGNIPKRHVSLIAESLQRFGQVRPVLVLADGTIVAGHHVTKAATQLGWTHVAVIPADFETRSDAFDYLVADNQLAAEGLRYVQPADQLALTDEIAAHGSFEGTGITREDYEDQRRLQLHKTEMMRLGELKDHGKRYRRHTEEQIEQVRRSLEQHGFYRDVVVARDGTILAGHAVVRAAEWLGLNKVPVTRLDVEPDSPEALKILAGDNEVDTMTEVDDRVLSELLKRVRDEDEHGLEGTGYDDAKLAGLVLKTRPASEIPDIDAAAHWVGLPAFEASDPHLKLVVQFETDELRQEFLNMIDHQGHRHVRGRAISIWWPERPRQDLHALRFDDVADWGSDINANEAREFTKIGPAEDDVAEGEAARRGKSATADHMDQDADRVGGADSVETWGVVEHSGVMTGGLTRAEAEELARDNGGQVVSQADLDEWARVVKESGS